jgi:DNA-binding cell septation regulator SpoVG
MALTFSAKVNLVKNPQGPLRAYATLVINNLIEINGFRVVEGSKGLFVAAPQTKGTKQTEDGKDQYFDDVRFSDADEKGFSETKTSVQQTILEAYGAVLGASGRGDTAAARTNDPKPSGKRPGMARTSSW